MSRTNPGTELLNRRTVLKAAGVGLVAGVGMSGTASAKKNTCPDGLTLLAKYNVSDEGDFAFETGRDSLNIDGSEITFTITARKPDGGILAFEFDSTPYFVNSISVKAGSNTFTKTIEGESGSFDIRNYDDQGPVQAISNVLFCKDVFWQLDFGEGEPDSPPYYDDTAPSELVLAALSDRELDDFQNPSFGEDDSPNGDALTLANEYFENLDTTKLTSEDATDAQIRVNKSSGGFRVHIAAWEMPGPFPKDDRDGIDEQVLYDSVTTSESATGDLDLEVSLPTP